MESTIRRTHPATRHGFRAGHGDADNGRQVHIRQGDILDIVLPDDYETSKAQWRDDDTHDESVLEDLGSKYSPDETPPGSATPGLHNSRYQGASPGTTHITLIQEVDALPPRVVKRFDIDVTVHSA